MSTERVKIEVIRDRVTFKPLLRMENGDVIGFAHLEFRNRAETLRTCANLACGRISEPDEHHGYVAIPPELVCEHVGEVADIVETVMVEVTTES